MQFTIEKDLTIKGTRGETGNIHITFDRDMTGTKGVFLVKRSFDTSDNDAFLIKNFIFGTNPAISGREIIISLTREDTEHMPILLPDSPYVFASDYKDIECSNYVWAIKLGSSCYTDTVIPRPGTTYPTFRLYNEAYFDKEGTPVVPHPPFPSPDIYATKKDLIHYAAAQKQLTDQLSGGIYELSGSVRLGFLNMAERHLSDIDGLDKRIDKLEEESHDIPGIIVTLSGLQSVVSGQTAAIGVLGMKVSGMEKSVTSAVERSIAASDAALEARESVLTLASSVESQLATFTDMFITSGGDLDYGVDAKKVFVKDYWKTEPTLPVLGSSMPALGAIDVSKDMITVDDAVQNLDGVDKILAERIEAISSGVGPGLIVLSGNVTKEFGAVRGEIATLSSDAKNYTDAMYTQGIAVVSGLGVEIKGEVSSLSGNAKVADEVLAARIGEVGASVETGISVLSGNVVNEFAIVRGEVSSLSGNAKEADELLSARIEAVSAGVGPGIEVLSGNVTKEFGSVRSEITSLSGKAATADENLAAAIAGFQTDVSDRFVALSGHAHQSIKALSGAINGELTLVKSSITTLSSDVDAAISEIASSGATALSALSSDASNTDAALANSISTLSSGTTGAISNLSSNVSNAISNLSSNTASAISSLSGDAQTTDAALAARIAELSGGSSGDLSALAARVTNLSSSAQTADGALHTEVTNLSGNVKSYVDAVSGNTYDKSVTDALGSINWFLEHTYTPWIQTSDRQILLYALNSAASGDNGIRAGVSAEITRATGAEDQKIDKASIIKSFDGSLDDTQVPGAKTTYDFVNSSINGLAAYYITKNAAGDAFATKAELTAAVASKEFYNGGKLRVPTKNDYCVVLADESRIDKGLTPTTRYVFDGTLWAFQYVVNSTTFTQAQVNALNSGITKDIHGAITSNISTLSGDLNGLSSDCVLTKAANETRFSNIDTTIANLSSDVSGSIKVLSDDLDDLEGVVTSNYSTLNGAISNLSSNASTTDEALKTSISTLSSDASATDSALAGIVSDLSGYSKNADIALHGEITSLSGSVTSECAAIRGAITSLSGAASSADSALASSISTLSSDAGTTDAALATTISNISGYAKNTDLALHAAITSLSGNAKTTDIAIEADIGELSGYAANHEGRIKSFEESRYFDSVAESRIWCKGYISGLVFKADGTMDPKASKYNDRQVLTLVLGIVQKLAADDHYFESQAQANAWVKSIIPLIQLNADGTLKDDASEYTDEDVLKLVLAIVNKMATLH